MVLAIYYRTYNCEVFLKDTFKYNWEMLEKRENNPLAESEFKSLPLRTKVEILQCLCDYRLDATDIMDQLKVSLTFSKSGLKFFVFPEEIPRLAQFLKKPNTLK
jgi:hypothetical protein